MTENQITICCPRHLDKPQTKAEKKLLFYIDWEDHHKNICPRIWQSTKIYRSLVIDELQMHAEKTVPFMQIWKITRKMHSKVDYITFCF